MASHRIPFDLITEILVWLPANSVLRFKCVCKEWYNLIKSPLFIKRHINKSLEPNSQNDCILFWTSSYLCLVDDLYNPFNRTLLNWPKDTISEYTITTVGSCNGLACFKLAGTICGTREPAYFGIKYFLICNPTTCTFKSILPSPEKKWSRHSVCCGFGYDSEHDDYKIVVTRYVWREDDRSVCIYSFKTNLWSCPTPITRVSTARDCGVVGDIIFENKMLHYLVSAETQSFSKEYRIARFDVVSEKWRDDLSLPVQGKKLLAQLGKLAGRLYLHVCNIDVIRSSDFWMIEEDGSWKKMFHLPQYYLNYQYPIAGQKDGSRVLSGK